MTENSHESANSTIDQWFAKHAIMSLGVKMENNSQLFQVVVHSFELLSLTFSVVQINAMYYSKIEQRKGYTL